MSEKDFHKYFSTKPSLIDYHLLALGREIQKSRLQKKVTKPLNSIYDYQIPTFTPHFYQEWFSYTKTIPPKQPS